MAKIVEEKGDFRLMSLASAVKWQADFARDRKSAHRTSIGLRISSRSRALEVPSLRSPWLLRAHRGNQVTTGPSWMLATAAGASAQDELQIGKERSLSAQCFIQSGELHRPLDLVRSSASETLSSRK
jgi:hypothetical protein